MITSTKAAAPVAIAVPNCKDAALGSNDAPVDKLA